jgi:hypothetical protein
VNRIDHGVLGAASGLLYAKAAQLGVGESVAAGAAAWVFSRGRLSPDGDQYGPLWTREGWLLRLLGRLASWKVLGRLWTVYARLLVFALGGTLFPSWREKAQAAGDPAGHRRITHGWGDALFGRKVWGTDGHGIPLGPWWRYWSPVPQQFRGRPVKGLRSDGLTAHCFALGVAAPASAFLLLSIAGI